MIEVLQFVFSSFWVWAGTIILILAIAVLGLAIVPNISYKREVKS